VSRRVLAARPAEARLSAVHHGRPHPARAALQVGGETWLATPAGVLRFDGRLWATPGAARPLARVDVASGLPALAVNDLRADGADVLVATDSGLARVDRAGRVRRTRLAGVRVTALAEGLIGTWDGLYRGRELTRVPGTARLPVTALRRCGTTTLVATHDRGLLVLDGDRLTPVSGAPASRFSALACRGGLAPELLAVGSAGLFRLRGGQAAPVLASPRHLTTVLAGGGRVVLGGFDDGLLELEGDRVRPLGLAGRVSLLHRAPDGGLLVGAASGLFVLRGGRPTRVPLDGPPAGPITALAVGQSSAGSATVWAGGFDSGLGRLAAGAWSEVPVFDRRLTALALDAAGRLWVGTAGGLGLLEGGRVVRVRDERGWLARHVSTLRTRGDRDPTVWVGVHPGLVAIDTSQFRGSAMKGTFAMQHLGARGREADAGLVGPTLYGLAWSGAGLWLGSDDGLGRLTRAGASALTDLGGVLPDNWINDVRALGDEVVVLTLRSGLLRLTPAGSEVLASGLMTSPGVLVLTPRQILFGTNAAGLAVLERPRSGAPHVGRWRGAAATSQPLAAPLAAGGGGVRTFGSRQGLPSTMVTALAYEPAADRLWIGGDAGVTRLDHLSTLSVPDQYSQREEVSP